MIYDLEKLEMLPPALPSLDETEAPTPVVSEGHISPFQLQCVVSIFLLLAILFVHLWLPQGSSVMKGLLVADKVGPIEQAGQEMVKEIFSGEPLPEAIAVFCREALNALP